MYHLYYLNSNIDDRVYIGITKYPEKRHKDHLRYSIRESHYNGNWIRKTLERGGEIKMNVICSNLTTESAMILEKKMISMFRSLNIEITNTADGGLGFNHKGIPHSEEHKKNIELAQPHKVRIPKDILYDLYVNQNLSKKKIGDIYGCGATTIDRRLNEYKIEIRKTKNYKVSYQLSKEEVLNMYLNKKMTIMEISNKFGIGNNGVRTLLKRENIDTGLNRFKSVDKEKIKKRYYDLLKMNIKKMKIYSILSEEFNLSSGYISKLNFK
jgi:predicted GIY-YIG superfamily endonuclease